MIGIGLGVHAFFATTGGFVTALGPADTGCLAGTTGPEVTKLPDLATLATCATVEGIDVEIGAGSFAVEQVVRTLKCAIATDLATERPVATATAVLGAVLEIKTAANADRGCGFGAAKLALTSRTKTTRGTGRITSAAVVPVGLGVHAAAIAGGASRQTRTNARSHTALPNATAFGTAWPRWIGHALAIIADLIGLARLAASTAVFGAAEGVVTLLAALVIGRTTTLRRPRCRTPGAGVRSTNLAVVTGLFATTTVAGIMLCVCTGGAT